MTGETDYELDGQNLKEPNAYFGAFRIKRKIFENSSIGVLFVTKNSDTGTNSVFDIDGAFRDSDWQLAYQLAASLKNSKTDFAFSTGFRKFTKSWGTLYKMRGIGKNFDVSEIGFVPWRGTFSSSLVSGPLFIYDEGHISNIFIYTGANINYEDEDLHYDRAFILGLSTSMRNGWGFEINILSGKSKDNSIIYNSLDLSLSSWINVSQNWSANFWSGYSNTYNFRRGYLAFYSWFGSRFSIRPYDFLNFGSSFEMFVEGNPSNKIEDITFTSRPFISLTPINNFNLRLYVDNLYLKSSDKLERLIVGFLFSWNFSAKSWIYLAINELKSRTNELDEFNNIILSRLTTVDRVGVFKIKYLYYF
jgi:hypothetical protein